MYAQICKFKRSKKDLNNFKTCIAETIEDLSFSFGIQLKNHLFKVKNGT